MYFPDSEWDNDNDESETKTNALANMHQLFSGVNRKGTFSLHPTSSMGNRKQKNQAFYVSKVKEVITETVHTLAPNDTDNLLKATLNSITAGNQRWNA